MSECKLVPVESTQAMAEAGASIDGRLSVFKADKIYRAMIAAAPSPWQDIASAPSEQKIILYWPYWQEAPIIGSHDKYGWHADGLPSYDGHNPERWMHLPATPAAKGIGE